MLISRHEDALLLASNADASGITAFAEDLDGCYILAD